MKQTKYDVSLKQWFKQHITKEWVINTIQIENEIQKYKHEFSTGGC